MASAAHPDPTSLSTAVTQLDGRVGHLEHGQREIISELKSLTAVVGASQRTNWTQIISFASFVAILIGGAWAIIDLKNQVALAPVIAQGAISTQERQSLGRQAEELKAKIGGNDSEILRLHERFKEVETQFKNLGQDYNKFAAEQYRTNAILWSATGKLGEYPEGPYFFPSFSQHLPSR